MSLSIQGNRPGNGRDSLREGAADRISVSITSQLARNVAALVFVAGVCGLAALVVFDRSRSVGAPAASSAALTAAVAVVARGVYLGRPVTAAHAAMALLLLFGVVGAHLIGASLWCATMAVAAAAALACPTASRPDPAAVPDASAAVAYRTRLGLAVVSGDPIGQPEAFGELVDGFAALCRGRGWRIVVLGCSKDRLSLWQGAGVIRPALHVVPIGCDVEVDVQRFALTGRRFRNLRQAVARTRHRGVTTQLIDEQDLDPTLAAELAGVLHASHHAARWERGFSMILDSALEGRYPGVVLMIGRDSAGVVQGFHRYLIAGDGSDVTLDVPWRRPGAPNGLDERLTVDMIEWCKSADTQRLSLAFAAFPDLFDNADRRGVDAVYYRLVSLGSPLIRLETLYRYLRKFHALGNPRYVLLARRHIPLALIVRLSLEFLPRRRVLTSLVA